MEEVIFIVLIQVKEQITETDEPEITHDNLSDFISECIIGWTLENYNYDGSRKVLGNG